MRQSEIVFGQNYLDEPEPGLGLIVYDGGDVRLFGRRYHERRMQESDGKPYHFGMTDRIARERGLKVLEYLSGISRAPMAARDRDFFEYNEEGCPLFCRSRGIDDFQVEFFCRAYDSLYSEETCSLYAEENESWGPAQISVGLPYFALHAFLTVLRDHLNSPWSVPVPAGTRTPDPGPPAESARQRGR